MSDIRTIGHILVYPSRGSLLFATDFHGQLEDFRRVVTLYEQRRHAGEDLYLLFAGDFVHGPAYSPEEFPDYLGDYQRDETPTVLAELDDLLARDDRVRALLGNHEHAHIGGPHTHKFHTRDPDEVEYLETLLGPTGTSKAHSLFREFKLVALTPCNVLFLHGAPHVVAAGFQEVAEARLEGYSHLRIADIYKIPVVGELLWNKGADSEVAERFFDRMTFEGMRPRVAVYGHDIVQEGFWRCATNQIVVSTSFGLRRQFKTVCQVDLAGSYANSNDFRDGIELCRLYES